MLFRRNLIITLFSSIILSICNPASGALNADDYPTLDRIIINGDSLISFTSEKPATGTLTLDHRHKNVAFELSKRDSLVYRFLLEGFDTSWSQWHETGFKEYTNLPAGKYKLRIAYTDLKSMAGEQLLTELKVLPVWYVSKMAVLLYLCLTALIIWALYTQLNLRFARTQFMLEQIIHIRTEDLIIEKEKTENLLANVLPKNTASEIMETGKATKMKYNFVTVLFSDIQGFTQLTEEMNPEVLIDELDKFFFYFDSVVEKLGIEKIKTIGDAYMCAGGIPEKNRTNPVEVILAAIEMQSYMTRLKEISALEGMKLWDIRIGIHTGTVVAGVVGHKKLSYDIWGDTVNTASRMESSGEAGKINISGTTYEFVKEFFICEHRGKMPVKYKGEIDMYFVNGIRPDLRDPDGKPNMKFSYMMQKIKLLDIEETVIKMFEDEAPPNLYFHNASLVRSISNQVELLAIAEKLHDEEYVNLKLASIFLFSGFISDYDYEQHAEASLVAVEEILSKYGFSQTNTDKVKMLISNSYDNKHESVSDKILHDARYDYLGRVDYLKLADKLWREETEYGILHNRAEWPAIQRKLLIKHEFLTDTAKLLRSVPLEDQIASLRAYYV